MSKFTSLSISVAEIPSGDEAVLCEDCSNSFICRELEAMGVVPGIRCKVNQYGSLSVLEVNSMRIGLTFSVAKQIKVFHCSE